jgi:peptidoglycan/LPS O-acetylase OafA/YrhL
MIAEQEKYGNFQLKKFFIRRSLRLFPVQYCFIAFVYFLTLTTPATVPRCSFITAMTFTKNYACGEWIDGHLWSLAVEEQFYLLWAIAFALLPRSALIRLALGLIAIAPMSRALEYALGSRFYPWLTSNIDSLMIGCLLGLLAQNRSSYLARAASWHPMLMRAVAVMLIYVQIILRQELLLGKLTVTIGPLVQNLCIAYLIMSLVYSRQGITYRVMNSRAMVFFGLISYSLYVWQMPFLAPPYVYGNEVQWFTKFPIDLAIVFCSALLSYYILERPLAALRNALHSRKEPPVGRIAAEQKLEKSAI